MVQYLLLAIVWLVVPQNSFTQFQTIADNKEFTKHPELSDTTKTIFNPSVLKEGTTNFKISLTMRGQEFKIISSQSVSKITVADRKIVRITESSSGAMGITSDTTDYDGVTLYPISQRSYQGQASLTMTFTEKSINGLMMANGQPIPINAVLTEPTLPSSSSNASIIATLPFREDYSITINLFDVLSATVRKHSVRVLAKERISITKGSFITYKVEMVPEENDGMKYGYWVNIVNHEIVKMEIALPEMMGGGTMIGELQ